MSILVKVLEGVVTVEHDLGYFFSNPPSHSMSDGIDNQEEYAGDTNPLVSSILSGPWWFFTVSSSLID